MLRYFSFFILSCVFVFFLPFFSDIKAKGQAPYDLNRLPIEVPSMEYPKFATDLWIFGEVTILITINSSGEVIKAIYSSGDEIFAFESIECAKKWKFKKQVSDSVNRTEKLLFKFKLIKKDDLNTVHQTIYKAPFELEVIGVPTTVPLILPSSK